MLFKEIPECQDPTGLRSRGQDSCLVPTFLTMQLLIYQKLPRVPVVKNQMPATCYMENHHWDPGSLYFNQLHGAFL